MRVIAGTLGGRRLAAPAGTATRPTPDRVREALYSSLGDVQGAAVLDLYAGSGALGIEALSRGAGSAVFVEPGRHALAALRANLDALGLAPPAARVLGCDAARAVASLAAEGARVDLCLVDPPFRDLPAVLERLPRWLEPLLSARARLVIEGPASGPPPSSEPWNVADRRDRAYGSVRITVLHLDTDARRTPDT